MAISCPKCKTRVMLSATEVGASGRLVRCPHCSTTWLARHFAGDVYGFRTGREPASKHSLIIEADPGPAGGRMRRRQATAAMPAAANPLRRYGFAAGTAGLVLGLIAVVLLAPAVSALPGPDASAGGAGAIVLGAVETRTVRAEAGETILVAGELTNPTDREMDMPAVRIVLRQADAEVHAWRVEPAKARLAPGARVTFVSASASPAPGATDVAVTLAARAER